MTTPPQEVTVLVETAPGVWIRCSMSYTERRELLQRTDVLYRFVNQETHEVMIALKQPEDE